MKQVLLLISSLFAFLFVSCAPTTPLTRIEKNQAIYNDLSTKEQELVSRGQIAEGMSPGAVYLAWGHPERRLEGQKGTLRTMRWDYTSMQPIYTTDIFGHYGYGHYGRHGRRYSRAWGFAPSVEYIPARSATVWFENDEVHSWERLR